MPAELQSTISSLEDERARLEKQADILGTGRANRTEFNKVVNRIAEININLNTYEKLSNQGYSKSEIDEIVATGNLRRASTIAKQQTSKETGLSVRELEQRAADVKAQTGGIVQTNKEPVVVVKKIEPEAEPTIQSQSKQPVEIVQAVNTVSEARDPTFKEAEAQTSTAFKYGGTWQGIKTGVQSYSGGIFKREKLKNAISNFWKSGQELRYDLAKTAIKEGDVTEEQIKRAAELGSQPDYITYMKIQEERIGADSDAKISEIQNNIQIASNDYSKKQANLVAEGKITYEQANSNVQDFNKRLLESGEKEYTDHITPKINKAQKEGDAIAKKGQISSIAFGTVTSLALGFGVGGALAGASRGVQIGANVIGGGLFAKETVGLTKDVFRGDAGFVEVVGFGVQTAAFIGGAKLGSGTRPSATQINLESAIGRSNVVTEGKGIITETELAKLSIPEANKIELQGRIKAGNALRKIEVEIKPTSTSDAALINKELPYRKIEFVQVTDSLGNVVESVAVGKVEVAGKSGKVYKQDVLAQSTGSLTPEGVLETETTTLIAESKKGKSVPKKAVFTREVSTGVMTKKGNLRVVQTSTGVRLVNEVESRGKPLTEAQLRNLIDESMGEKGKKISQTEFLEIQRRAKFDLDAVIRGSDALIKKQEKYIGKSIGVSTQILEVPKAKGKYPKTPFSKTFPKEPTIDVKKIFSKSGEMLKQVGRNIKEVIPEFDIKRTKVNVETGTRAALEEGIKKVGKSRQIPQLAPVLTQKQINEMLNQGMNRKQLEKINLNQNIFEDVNIDAKINQQMRNFQKQFENQRLKVNQMLEQPQQLQQPNINVPNFPVPNVPNIPVPPIFDYGGRDIDRTLKQFDKALKKSSKRSSAYTPSLPEIFFEGTPLEVTEKQFAELNKKVFTGLEVRPLLKLKKKKTSKKRKK